MKFPKYLALAALVAGFSLAPWPAWSAPSKTAKASVKKAKKTRPADLHAAEVDSLARADSLARFAPVRMLDSLLHLDSLRRLGPLKGRDSIAAVRIDSARRVDSAKSATDLRRKADSTAKAARAWFVARPRDFSQSPGFSLRLQERLGLELRRSGRVDLAPALDTNSSFDGTWKAARASSAGRMLYTALYSGSRGSINAICWVFDLSNGQKLDSASGESTGVLERFANDLARKLAKKLTPTLADSVCQADSAALALRVWAVAQPRNWSPEPSASGLVRDSLTTGLGRSHRASWKVLAVGDSCQKRRCVDSVAATMGIERVIHSTLSRLADSTWVLSLWVASAVNDSLTDSLRVLDTDPARLSGRALQEILPWPATCPRACPPTDSRAVWSFAISSDSATRRASKSFAAALVAAYRARTDRQFMSLVDPLAGKDSAVTDSVARALGVRKLVVCTIGGNDSSRTLRARVRDLRTGASDSLVLSRGGPERRVLPWFARHLAAFGTENDPPCGNRCREDSLLASQATWTVLPPTGTDTAVNRILAGRLVETFHSQMAGKIVALGNNLPCTDMPCLDSVAAARSIQKLLWPSVKSRRDSLWTLSAMVSDVSTDEWTDSVQVLDTGALEALSRLSARLWTAVAPNAGPCDSCLSRDTLEAALAIASPVWSGAPDSLGKGFRETVARILSREGSYQVLDIRKVDSLSGTLDSTSLSRLRCRLGASYLVRSSASLEKEGWLVKASLTEIATGKTIASVQTQDKSSWPGRPGELAPWVAHRLLGTDTTTVPPKSTHSWGVPWGKLATLLIPLAIGIYSVVYHW